MNTQLDSEIRHAMAELADAAPPAHSAATAASSSFLADPTTAHQRRPVAIASAGLLVAASLATFIALRPTDPSTRGITASTAAPTPTAAVPIALADGWQFTGVSRTVRERVQVTEQVFGTQANDGTVERGFYIRVVNSIDYLPLDDPIEPIDVRGHDGSIFVDGRSITVTWLESGQLISVFSRNLSRTELIDALADLVLVPNPEDGFLPPAGRSSLPLLSSNASEPRVESVRMAYQIRPIANPDDAVLETVTGATWPRSDQDVLFFGDGGSRGAIEHPDEGVVTSDRFSDIEDRVFVDELNKFSSLALSGFSPEQILAMRDESSANLGRFPEVGQSNWPTGTAISVHGGTIVEPDALCLSIAETQSCALSQQQTPINPSHVASVEINGEWYMIGVEPVGQPKLILVPWTVDMSPAIDPQAIIEQQETISGEVRWWYAKIPAGINNVTTAVETDTNIRSEQMIEAFRRWGT